MNILEIKSQNKINFKEEFLTKQLYTGIKIKLGRHVFYIPKIDKSVIASIDNANAIVGKIFQEKPKIKFEFLENKTNTVKEEILKSDVNRSYITSIKFFIFMNQSIIAIEKKYQMNHETSVSFFNKLFEKQHDGKVYTSYRTETPIDNLANFANSKFKYNVKKPNPIHSNSLIKIEELFRGLNAEHIQGVISSKENESLNLSGIDLIESIIELSSSGYGNIEILYKDKDGNEKKYNQKKDALLLVSPNLEKDNNEEIVNWLLSQFK